MSPRVVISPYPMAWSAAPETRVQCVIFRLEFSLPVIMEPRAEQAIRGRSLTPAIIGLVLSTISKRCGRLMTAMKKVKPERSVHLSHVCKRKLIEYVGKGTSYRIAPPMTLWIATVTGNVTCTLPFPPYTALLLKYNCQRMKAMKQAGDMVSNAPTIALLQGRTYVPHSCIT